jgi:hypothetical protein
MIGLLLTAIGWGPTELSRRLGCSQAQVRRWIDGRDETPRAILEWLQPIAEAVERQAAPEWRVRRRRK